MNLDWLCALAKLGVASDRRRRSSQGRRPRLLLRFLLGGVPIGCDAAAAADASGAVGGRAASSCCCYRPFVKEYKGAVGGGTWAVGGDGPAGSGGGMIPGGAHERAAHDIRRSPGSLVRCGPPSLSADSPPAGPPSSTWFASRLRARSLAAAMGFIIDSAASDD